MSKPHFLSKRATSMFECPVRAAVLTLAAMAVAALLTLPGLPVHAGPGKAVAARRASLHTTLVDESLPVADPASTGVVTLASATGPTSHATTRAIAELSDFVARPTTTDIYVVSLIHRDFPVRAWHDAEAVAWCESKFRPTDIGFDSNGTHDRGLFQLNDGGTQQYLFQMLGFNPANLNLGFNPVVNVRAAALLYARDGWSHWSCASAI